MFQKFSPYAAPKSWYFTDPDTGYRFPEYLNKEMLVRHIISYRAQNELHELEFIDATVENYLCARPENVGGCEPLPAFERSVFQWVKGGVALLSNLLYPSFAPQAVAEERAAICVKCPLNVFPDKGPYVEWADSIARGALEERRVSCEAELGNCNGCSCLMKSKVFYDGVIRLSTDEKRTMANANPACWQVKESK